MAEELTNGKNALKYGLYAALCMIAVALILWALTDGTSTYIGLLVFLPLFFFVAWGAIEYRNKALNNVMSYGQAFGSLFMIGLVASVIYILYTYVYVKFIDPEVIERGMELAEERILNRFPDFDEDQLDSLLERQKRMSTPLMMAVSGFINNVIVSTLFSVIAAFIIKRPDENQAVN